MKKIFEELSEKKILNKQDEFCPICGQKSKLVENEIFAFYEFTCNCESKKHNKSKKAKKNVAKLTSLKNKLKDADFGYIFRSTRLKKLNCEKIDVAKMYIKNFDKRKQYGLFIYGSAGNGKTSLAISIGKELILKGYKVKFLSVSRALRRLQNTYGNNKDFITEVKKLANYDLLILDDMFREVYKDRTLTDLFDFFDYLYTNCSNVVFTANTEQIEKVKTIPELRAIMDRLRSMAKFISFQGKSMRG